MPEPESAIVVHQDAALEASQSNAGLLGSISAEEWETRLTAASLHVTRLQELINRVLVEDRDYGVIPGTQKPTLLKPGAERLCQIAGLAPVYERTVTRGDGQATPRYEVVTTCRLERHGGAAVQLAGQGIGSCSSHERKYRYRLAKPACPDCGNSESLLKSKREPEWFCWAKRGGCGATFPLQDQRILTQPAGHVENPDVLDQAHTIGSIADKRALVSAVRTAFAASGVFEAEEAADHVAPQGGADEPEPAAGKRASGRKAPAASRGDERLTAQDQGLLTAEVKKRVLVLLGPEAPTPDKQDLARQIVSDLCSQFLVGDREQLVGSQKPAAIQFVQSYDIPASAHDDDGAAGADDADSQLSLMGGEKEGARP